MYLVCRGWEVGMCVETEIELGWWRTKMHHVTLQAVSNHAIDTRQMRLRLLKRILIKSRIFLSGSLQSILPSCNLSYQEDRHVRLRRQTAGGIDITWPGPDAQPFLSFQDTSKSHQHHQLWLCTSSEYLHYEAASYHHHIIMDQRESALQPNRKMASLVKTLNFAHR